MPRAGPRLGRGCFTRGEGRPASAGAGRATGPRRGGGGEGGGCWAGLGFRPGFGPQSVLLFKIPFLFSKFIYNLQTNLNSIQI
jgi:hypothetical protein